MPTRPQTPKLYVGTSGYSYPEWKGAFYPQDLPAGQMLHFYGQHFRGVEINNTFHRMPKPAVLQSWASQVPAAFRFVLKAPQRITHVQRLRQVDDSLAYFLEVSQTLKGRLGPLLFQLPPNLKKDLPLLRDFLCLIANHPLAMEFRHQSWFDEEIFALLRQHNAALCIADAETDLEVPFVATADWGYLRLRRPDYRQADLKRWAQRLQDAAWRHALVFFKHEEEATGPKLAKRFLKVADSLQS